MQKEMCRHFNGYKPCLKNPICETQCPNFEVPEQSILIVHLGALGAVLRSTALLTSIKRKYPKSYITWLTEENAKPLLYNNPYIDRILCLSTRDILVLSGLKFDIGLYIDKSVEIAGIQKIVKAKVNLGFTSLPLNGAIVPLTPSSNELWDIGLSNEKKFFENKKTEILLVAEALELPYKRDEYILRVTKEEDDLSNSRRMQWSKQGSKVVIGFNTGTSGIIPNKTISNESWILLLKKLNNVLITNNSQFQFVLLGGGREDYLRNEFLSKTCVDLNIVKSPTLDGIRDGICSMKAVDLVITADSLGMHMAIALEKLVIAWFGPTCEQEIDLFDRGIKIKSSFSCSPCWKRHCSIEKSCNESIDINLIIDNVMKLKFQNIKMNEMGLHHPTI